MCMDSDKDGSAAWKDRFIKRLIDSHHVDRRIAMDIVEGLRFELDLSADPEEEADKEAALWGDAE